MVKNSDRTKHKSKAKPERKRKQVDYKPFRLQKKIKPLAHRPDSILRTYAYSLKIIFSNKVAFAKYSAIATLIFMSLTRGLNGLEELAESRRSELDNVEVSRLDELSNQALDVISLSQSGSASGAFYRFVMYIILSMALIWIIRSIYDGKKVTMKGAFYNGTVQFVPFMLVMMFIFIESWPALIASSLTSSALSAGLLVTNTEKIVFYGLMAGLTFVSFILMASTVFSLIIVSLGGSTPWDSIKAGFSLSKYRRGDMLLRFLVGIILTISVWISTIIITLQINRYAAEVGFYFISLLAFLVLHVYAYVTYRQYLK